MMNSRVARTLLVAASLLGGACGGQPEGSGENSENTSDELGGTVRVTATLEGEFTMLTSNTLFSTADSGDGVCLRAANGYDACTTKGELHAEDFCLAAQQWAKPGVLIHPEVLTRQLLGDADSPKRAIPNALGEWRATSANAYPNERVTCSFRASDQNVDPRYQRVFTVDVPANTPGLEKVDGTSYTTRFDLPDYIRYENPLLDSAYFAPDPKAQWVEAGQITVRYARLERR